MLLVTWRACEFSKKKTSRGRECAGTLGQKSFRDLNQVVPLTVKRKKRTGGSLKY